MRQIIRQAFARLPILDGMFRRVIWSRIHFPEPELRLLDNLPGRPFDVALDVGGALGSYSWVLARKSRRVIAFEPGDLHHRNLAAGSALSRVTVFKAAVGDKAGTAQLISPGDDNEARHLATLSKSNPAANAANAKTTEVQVVVLDEVVRQELTAGQKVSLIKIDVEGFENAVLAGAMETITANLPIIIAEIEIVHNPDYRVPFETLAANGYECFAHSNNAYRPVTADDVAQLQANWSHIDPETGNPVEYVNNFVFLHPENQLGLNLNE